jgi:nucleoside-diphosphate-sugar epimerase
MKVLLLGGTGYIGSNLVNQRPNWTWTTVGSRQCNLLDKNSIINIQNKYDVVINVAGFYGGIVFNQRYQKEILYKNLEMTSNVWRLLNQLNPKKFINIGSACLYPRTAINQISESQISDRNYHPSIKYSAMAKHLQLDLLKNYELDWEYLILSNVYGPGEHLSFEKSHFVGSLTKKLQDNKNSVIMLGTGSAIRDFIYISDVAEAICRYAELPKSTCSATNISTGNGTSIFEMTETLTNIVNPNVKITWGDEKDNGVAYKVLNNDKMIKDIDYRPNTSINEGLIKTWEFFKNE